MTLSGFLDEVTMIAMTAVERIKIKCSDMVALDTKRIAMNGNHDTGMFGGVFATIT